MALNPKKLAIAGGGALCSALVVIMLLTAIVGGGDKEVAQGDSLEVMLASKDLVAGDTLDETRIKWVKYPKERIYEGLVTRELNIDKDDQGLVTGKLKRAMRSGEPITQSAMVSDSDASLVAAQLEPGMRAVGVKVTAESSAGGFIMAGDHVDVLLSYKVKVDKKSSKAQMASGFVEKNASETLLDNVRVIAIDQNTEKNDNAKVGRTATLSVSPKQAEILLLATEMGELSLTLRGLNDASETTDVLTRHNDITTDVEVSKVLSRLHSQNEGGGTVKNVRIYNSVSVDSQMYAVATPSHNSTRVSANVTR